MKIFENLTIDQQQNIKVYKKAVGAVIIKYEDPIKILLIQRSKKDHWPMYWEFCRGKVEMNEDLISAVKREAKEETGLDVIPYKLIDTFQYLADEGTRLTTCYNFLCKLKNENQKIKLSKEHQYWRWISHVGEAELLLLPDQKKTVEKFLSKDNQIVNYPENNFTKNNIIDEYLMRIQRD